MSRLTLLALAFGLVVPAVAQKQPDRDGGPPPLMRKVFEMRKSVKLSGVRVVQFLDQGEGRLATEQIVRDGVNIRTEVVDGRNKGQISVEDEETRRVWSATENVIRENPAREAEFFMRFRGMGGRDQQGGHGAPPKFQETDGGRIAGVMTRLLEIKGPDGRVFVQTWIDPVHGVVLKNQSFDPTGKRTGYFEYTSVNFNPTIRPGTFTINKPLARVITVEDDLRTYARELGMKPYRLPASSGWRLVSVHKMDAKGAKVMMQFYKDKRSRLSLFVVQGPIDAERLKRLQRGETNSYVWSLGGLNLALIGDVSDEDLRRLAGLVGA